MLKLLKGELNVQKYASSVATYRDDGGAIR
jgi:hypothetical protein